MRWMPGKKAAAGGVAGLALTIAFVGNWEGLRTNAYLDIVGVPTVCYGETRGVEMGDSYTKAQCDDMLSARLAEFEADIRACITVWDKLPEKTRIALVSWAYNVGSGGVCRSTAVRRFNAGDYRGGCDAVTWWNRAGGQVVRGLVNRRAAEHQLCVADL